jgi:type IV secretory pathway protease TraF
MAPFFNVNSSPELPATTDWILVQKSLSLSTVMSHARYQQTPVQRGQIIVFYAPHDPTKLAVKRVIGIAGDRVQPLSGYAGGNEPVVVPYNHIWVEGDANSREKSVDSNWYGPISQNLVVGDVKLVLSPWYAPVVVKWEQHDYPAKRDGRVEENVVRDATIDPDTKSFSQGFRNGQAATELEILKRNRNVLPEIMRQEDKFRKLQRLLVAAKLESESEDENTRQLAQEVIAELGAAFEAVGLSKDGTRLAPVVEPVQEAEDSREQEIKRQRLQRYLERNASKQGTTSQNDTSSVSLLG